MASYTTILALALADAPTNRLSLRDLYLCVERHAQLLPFTSRPHWRRSVRHTLSKQPCFSRVDTNGVAADASARRCLWVMDEPRLPQPTREVLNLYRSGTPLPEVLRRLMTASSTSVMAKAGAFSQPRLRAGARDMDDAMLLSATAPPPASTGVPQASSLAGGAASSALLAALLNGGTPADAMAPQQKSEAFPLLDASALKHEHHGVHSGHMGQQPDAAGNPMAMLSGWATLAGYTPEELSSALAAAVAAADVENQRQRQREMERQQAEQRCLRQRLEQQHRLQQEQHQQQQQLTLAHAHPVTHQYGGGGSGGQMDPQAQDYYNLIMQSISSINNNNGVHNVRAVAAATADMAAGRGFSCDAPGMESESSSSHTGTSQPGMRDSGLGNEIDDDVSVQGRTAVAARYNNQPAPTSAYGYTTGPSMSEAAFQEYLLQTAADVSFAYGDEMA